MLLKDVVNTGVIETYLSTSCRGDGAASVRTRRHRRQAPSSARPTSPWTISLFTAEGGTFVGYGMEHQGLHAHLPYVAEIVDRAINSGRSPLC